MFTKKRVALLFCFIIFGLCIPTFIYWLDARVEDTYPDLEILAEALNIIGWALWPTWFLSYLALAPTEGEAFKYTNLVVLSSNGLFGGLVGSAYLFSSSIRKIWRVLLAIFVYILLQSILFITTR